MACILEALYGLRIICFVNMLNDEKVEWIFFFLFFCIPKQLYLEWNMNSENKQINGKKKKNKPPNLNGSVILK